jgi:hypothetical protein
MIVPYPFFLTKWIKSSSRETVWKVAGRVGTLDGFQRRRGGGEYPFPTPSFTGRGFSDATHTAPGLASVRPRLVTGSTAPVRTRRPRRTLDSPRDVME